MRSMLVPRMICLSIVSLSAVAGEATAASADQQSDAGEDLYEVTVTASRITRPGFQAPTPTTTVTAEDLERTGATDIAGYLNTLPAFRPSRTPATTIQSGDAIGANLIDLRALGVERALVLVNSRRHVPTQANGTVDFNVVPMAAIANIEVITGGASAAWGSDAVAGVVNLIFDSGLQGIRADAQYGSSAEGDGQERRISAAFGEDVFDGRGHLMAAAEYYKNEGVERQADRDWGARQWQRIANPLDTGPGDGQPSVITRENVNLIPVTDGGVILGPDAVSGLEFGPGGALVARQLGSLISPPFMVGGSGTALGSNDLVLSVPVERRSLLATFNYDLSDELRFFFEGSYAEAEAGPSVFAPPFAIGTAIGIDNAFMPQALRALMADNGVASIALGRTNVDFGYVKAATSTHTRSAVLGLDGKAFGAWSWEAYYQSGQTNFRSRQLGNLIVGNHALAADAVLDPATNTIVCRAALDAASLPAGLQDAARQCVPINLFGFGAPSAAAIDYVTGTGSSDQRFRQDIAAVELHGDLAALWAGPLSVAAGAEYRKETVDVVSDPVSQAGGFFFTNPKALNGEFDVREAFVEADLPLLSDRPFVRSLALNGAFRWTDYSTVGNVASSKLGVVWKPNEILLLRGTLSRDIRAPNIQELFLTRVQSFFLPRDPCDRNSQAADPVVAANCRAAGLPADFVSTTALVPSPTGGNPDLQEEQATTKTAGIVFSPRFAAGFQAAFDWFDISIDEAIAQLTPVGVLASCYRSPSFPNPSCSFISRDAGGQLAMIDGTFLNTASFRTSGIDGELQYGFDLADLFSNAAGAVQLRLLATYIWEKSSSTDGVLVFDRAGQVGPNAHESGLGGLPKLRWESMLGYSSGRFGAQANVHYVGKGKIDTSLTPEDLDHNDIGAEWTLDLAARYSLKFGNFAAEAFGGVNNVFNRDPPLIPYDFIQSYATNPGLYDVMGRYFYGGVRVRL